MPRDEEEQFLASRANVVKTPKPQIESSFELPPLMQMLLRQKEKYADPAKDLPKPRITVHSGNYNRAVVV